MTSPRFSRVTPASASLELGRSCVLESHRSKRAIELLWRGLLAYIRAHRIDVLIGCASFPGVSPRAHAEALSYLAYFAGAEGEWTREGA